MIAGHGPNIGHGYVKYVLIDQAGNELPSIVFPAQLAKAQRSVQGALGTIAAVEAAGAWWWTGEDAAAAGAPLTMIGQDRLRDPAVIPALLRTALERLGRLTGTQPEPGVCVAGLPAAWAQDKALAALLGARLREATATYTSIRVIAEPLGALYAELLDDHGRMAGDRALESGRIGVVDLGHHTIDIAVLHRGLPIASSLETWQLGTVTALRQIRTRLGALTERELSLHETDLAVRAEAVSARGVARALPPSWDAPLVEQGQAILSRLTEAWGGSGAPRCGAARRRRSGGAAADAAPA